MTKERLLEAIASKDPDGEGVERVCDAAKKRNLITMDACDCVLAHAWNAKGRGFSVGSAEIEFDNGEEVDHDCKDVTAWFDGFGTDLDANAKVLELLSGEGKECEI